MTTRSKILVRQPRERIREVLVERTWELSEFLEDIDHAELELHHTDVDIVKARHVWRAKANVPPLLAPHISADYFAWTAIVESQSADFVSHWRIEPHGLKESLTCSAQVDLSEALGGRATQVMIDVNIQGLDGRTGIETIAYRIVMVNWQKLVDAAKHRLETDH